MKYYLLLTLLFIVLHTVAQAAPFVDNGNGTVTDQGAGLVWQQSDDGVLRTWLAALDYCNDLTLGGSSAWRLPKIKELRAPVDESRFNPAIDPVFIGTHSNYYWSSTVNATDPVTSAWYVHFGNGSVSMSLKARNCYVRCVR